MNYSGNRERNSTCTSENADRPQKPRVISRFLCIIVIIDQWGQSHVFVSVIRDKFTR